MKKIFSSLLVFAFLFAFALVACTPANARGNNQGPSVIPENLMNDIPSNLPDNPAMAFVRGLGIGINIGNTLDAIGTFTWHAGETGWGNPPITRGFIRALKTHGYKTIRLPVTWAEYMGGAPGFIIEEERMSRVVEVVNWILAEDLYVIVNLHHDGGYSDRSWILNFADDPDGVARQFAAVWSQIATRFSGVSQEKLIFESLNEVGFDELWNRFGGGMSGKSLAYGHLNRLNQIFVDTVRGTPGNSNRFLLIAGYWTDITLTADPLFVMPTDTIAHRLIVSVHYYTPATFCLAEERDNSWGFRDSWGTNADYAELTDEFTKLRRRFLENGIPVILGEYGVTKRNKEEESRIRWMAAVTQISLNYGVCPVLWDTGINPAANNNSGEIQRISPYGMTDTLKTVWAAVRQ